MPFPIAVLKELSVFEEIRYRIAVVLSPPFASMRLARDTIGNARAKRPKRPETPYL